MLEQAVVILGEFPTEFLQLLPDFGEVELNPFTFLYKGMRKHKYFHKIFFGDLAQFLKKDDLDLPLLEATLLDEHELIKTGVLCAEWKRGEEFEETGLLGIAWKHCDWNRLLR